MLFEQEDTFEILMKPIVNAVEDIQEHLVEIQDNETRIVELVKDLKVAVENYKKTGGDNEPGL